MDSESIEQIKVFLSSQVTGPNTNLRQIGLTSETSNSFACPSLLVNQDQFAYLRNISNCRTAKQIIQGSIDHLSNFPL